MEEYIDIVDENGEPTGVSGLKSEIHKKGLYHHTAHVWCYTSEGQILLQQRAASKAIYPLLWDVSVAGHVETGERIEDAAIREAKEEIGLDISEAALQKIGVFKCFKNYSNGIKDYEFHNTFIIKINSAIQELTPQAGEVESLKFVSIPEFIQKLDHSNTNHHFIATNRRYYETVVKAIKQQLLLL
ncbi:Isopentenyldiphosphate isomerase [Formosa sp. Hel1_31_208]|uniref:NUDIX hydrolase n=1 Tax=Formosa sp. Hel1_31_208 TaxID=1798225 RepID=UPI00087C6683|nr:NUDIX domain-containing protein [Formosa sp. Hel1_31_208]SDS26286.1 Isopentenyldiphosphate isomerase [Formosa sp. Hel1_31_208]